MSREGPPIESLLRRLAETPAEFLAEPRVSSGGDVSVRAVVFDVVNDLGYTQTLLEVSATGTEQPRLRNWLRLVLIGAWLAHDPWFRAAGVGEEVSTWLTGHLSRRAKLVDAELYVTDPERREELARLLLAHLGITPAGESAEQAADRLSTVDSVERARVIEQMREKRARAEKLRKEMKAKRAQEAAARYSRE